MPEPIHDDVFGSLEWDDEMSEWAGPVSLRTGVTVGLSLVPDGEGEAAEAERAVLVEKARSVVAWLREGERDVTLTVSQHCVGAYNEDWREEEEPISAEEFAARIKLEGVDVQTEGWVILYYSDGALQMFDGHILAAEFDPDRQYRDFDLLG